MLKHEQMDKQACLKHVHTLELSTKKDHTCKRTHTSTDTYILAHWYTQRENNLYYASQTSTVQDRHHWWLGLVNWYTRSAQQIYHRHIHTQNTCTKTLSLDEKRALSRAESSCFVRDACVIHTHRNTHIQKHNCARVHLVAHWYTHIRWYNIHTKIDCSDVARNFDAVTAA